MFNKFCEFIDFSAEQRLLSVVPENVAPVGRTVRVVRSNYGHG
jgi:hypothetical protein